MKIVFTESGRTEKSNRFRVFDYEFEGFSEFLVNQLYPPASGFQNFFFSEWGVGGDTERMFYFILMMQHTLIVR